MTLGRERVMQTAEKMVARGKISQAIKEYRKLLRQNPNDANMLNRVGDLYARQDKVDDAVALFQKIAEGYSRDGFFVKAIAIYKKIIRLDPTQIEVYERLAELYHRQGLVSESRSQYLVLVDYYTKHNDMAATIEIHRKMADLEPNDPSPRVKLAELYLREGLLEETIGEYQRIAEVMLDHGRVEEATKVYIRALEVDSDDLAFISEAVLRLREEGEYDAATRVFEAAVERNPEAAKLAERMREHAAPQPQEAEAVEPRAEAEDPLAADDSVDVADLLGGPDGLGTAEGVSPEEQPEIAASSSIGGTPVTDEGAFVISLDDDPVEEEVEIDLAELEEYSGTPAAEVKGPAPPPTSVEALAASLGLTSSLTSSDTTGRIGAANGATSERPPTDAPPPVAAAAVPEAGDAAEAQPKQEIDARQTQLDEFLAEAEVFAKYGLESKALRRLEQALEIDPANFAVQRRQLRLYLERGSETEVIECAQRMLDREDVGGGASWEAVLQSLSEAGYSIVKGQVHGPVAAPDATAVEPEAAPPPAVEPSADEEGLEWLDEAARPDQSEDGELFDVEEEFFDLAAEIEKELASDVLAGMEEVTDVGRTGDESLAEIVEGFKQGVAEVLSPDAYDTHYNLGIAYREMDLVDEAIGEFQLSARAPEHLIDSCSMLGACFLEKGFPDLAVKWFRRGLDAPSITEEESLGLLYDLGSVYAAAGEQEAAYEVFVEIYGINSHYRDVVARPEELRGG